MISNFIHRGLYKTIDFLEKVKIGLSPTTLSLNPADYLTITYMNLKEYKKVYNMLLCDKSRLHLEDMVFCDCCSLLRIFNRNYALLSFRDKPKFHSFTTDRDEFLLYLEGRLTRDYTKILRSIKVNPLFWEAYLALSDLVNLENIEYINPQGPLRDFFFMMLYTRKLITRKHKINSSFPNLEAAMYYHKRDYDKAEQIFKTIIGDNYYFDLDYMDLYSNILYMKKDRELFFLAQKATDINRYRPETLCCIANYYSLKNDHQKAILYYEMCLKINPKHNIVYTLIGHEFIEIKDPKSAINAYNSALKYSFEDYRAWYSLGKAYEMLCMYDTALFFIKKAIEYKKEDPIIWITLGHVYVELKQYETGIDCFKRVVSLKEVLGYLYIAETYKTMKRYSDSVDYYEKYVIKINKKTSDVKKVCLFLEEYYRRINDTKKSRMYANMANED